MLKQLLYILLSFTWLINVFGQDNKEDSSGKFSGYMFGDYYFVVDNHNSEIKDQHGFWFRRIYFTYDYKIDSRFSSRIRLEMSNEGKYNSSDKMLPAVKDAWLKVRLSDHVIILGISPTPTFQIIEKYWGYRSVVKTPLDLQKMASSRDFGLAGKGQFDVKAQFKYHVMFSNGSSTKEEVDKGKSGMLSLAFFATKEIVFEIYGDYADKTGAADWYTLQGFVGYRGKMLRVGLQYSDQTRQIENSNDQKLRVASAFVTGDISEQVSLLGRIDRMFEPNPQGNEIAYLPFSTDAKSLLLILGVDWHPVKMVKLIPNVGYVTYSENSEGFTPVNDLIARITFYWAFK